MKLSRIILGVIIVVTISCKQSTTKSEFKNIINITKNNIIDEIKISELCDTIWEVKLRTQNNEVIGRISRVIATDSIILIADFKQQKIFLFNIHGDYINTINGKGKGPNEYHKISDVFINNWNEIEIIDLNGNKILYYSLEGKFVRFAKNNIEQELINCAIQLQNGDYFYYLGEKQGIRNKKKYNVIISSNGNLKYLLTNKNKFTANFNSEDSYIIKSSDGIFLHEPFRNEIFKIENNQLIKEYFIDFKNGFIPEKAFETNAQIFWESYIMNEKYYHFLGPVEITTNHIIFPLIKLKGEPPLLFVWINRKTNKAIVTKKIVDKNNVSLNLIPKCTLHDVIICIETGKTQDNPSLIFYKLKTNF
jgi:hypothetical protein